MTYQSIYELGSDPGFRNRLTAGMTNEASTKVNDSLADQALRNPDVTATWFMPYISNAPGFADQYATGGQEAIDDAELLAALQASWPKVAALYSDVLNPPIIT